MSRVKRGVTNKRRHRKVLALAKGYRGGRGRLFGQAKNAVMKAGMHAYAHRKTKKREFRQLWIARLNAAARSHGILYSRFMAMLNEKNIIMDRKILSEIAIRDPECFKKLVEFVATK